MATIRTILCAVDFSRAPSVPWSRPRSWPKPPVPAIVDCAKQLDASMLVLGTHGRRGFKRFVLGSTTERVVRMATVPVLTVQLAE
jgi:hypothetical protein